jgi:hypothetical protein
MFAGNGFAPSSRFGVVRSVDRSRALAVAMRDWRGGGGLRDEMTVWSQDWEGEGRDWDFRAVRICGARLDILGQGLMVTEGAVCGCERQDQLQVMGGFFLVMLAGSCWV